MHLIRLSINLAVLVVVGVAAACSTSPPPDISNLCAIYDDKPYWKKYVDRAAAKWNVSAPTIMAIIRHESSFRDDAQTPRTWFLGIVPTGRQSSAYGYSQALDGTWDWYRKSTGNWGADRDDFDDAADFIGWYMNISRRKLKLGPGDTYSHYLAYHEGHGGYSRGSWRSKSWLKKRARQVARTAETYRRQQSVCT